MKTRAEVTLSPKQTLVLEAVGLGLTYPEIGERLGISERTVRAYTDLLRRKFAVDGVPVATGRQLIPIAAEWFAARA
jgi:DNA-binding NarL/FixJ family response regulator